MRPHAEWLWLSSRTHHGGNSGKLPAARWDSASTRSVTALPPPRGSLRSGRHHRFRHLRIVKISNRRFSGLKSMSVLAAIAVLALLIVVHELGHFTAARAQGIHVNRFSLGFGPILWKYQGPETEYALRAFPLGGFVGFPDDDPDNEIPPEDPNLLRNRPLLDRAIVISAGVIANLIFAYFLLVGQVAAVSTPEFKYQPGVIVPKVAAEVSSAAAKAGIKPGDIILSVNNRELGASKQAIQILMSEIQTHPNQALS